MAVHKSISRGTSTPPTRRLLHGVAVHPTHSLICASHRFLYAEGGGQSQDISTNSMLRCNNCPTNECEDCPMFGIGDRVNGKACGNCPTKGCLGCPLATEYPEYSKIRARRDRKRRNLIRQRKEEAAENLGLRSGAEREL